MATIGQDFFPKLPYIIPRRGLKRKGRDVQTNLDQRQRQWTIFLVPFLQSLSVMNFGRWLATGCRSRPKCSTNTPRFRRGLVTMDGSAGPSDPHAYCREFVRKHDYDSYLNSYFYPRAAQKGFFAIKAFSVRRSSCNMLERQG